MNSKPKITLSTQAQRQLEILRQAVGKTLEQKRRLGHYAVIWKDGKPVLTGEDAPKMVESIE